MFVLTVGYVNMTTYPLTKNYNIIESVYFIYRLFLLFISILSFLLFLYTASWSYNRNYFHASIYILFYIMFCIINTMKKHYFLLYHVGTFDTEKVLIWTWPSQSTICSYAPASIIGESAQIWSLHITGKAICEPSHPLGMIWSLVSCVELPP